MFSSQELSEIKRRLEEGEKMKDVAASYGLSSQTLSDRLGRSGYRFTGTIAPVPPVPLLVATIANQTQGGK